MKTPQIQKQITHAALATLAFVAIASLGCPIKFWTGVSCPGCGMTRAWVSALTLHFDLAFAYHPLFWTVPPLFALVLMRDRMPRNVFLAIALVAIGAFVIVWCLRLFLPHDSSLLFEGTHMEDVVSIEAPQWWSWLRTLFDHVAHGIGGL